MSDKENQYVIQNIVKMDFPENSFYKSNLSI